MSFKPIKKSGFKEGVLVDSIVKEGPADAAGLQAGDIVVQIDGAPVTVLFPEEVPPLEKRLADYPIGSVVVVTYKRQGQSHDARIVTKKLEKDRGDESAFRAWGLVTVDITEKMARERRLESTDGVLVDSVRGGNPAQLAEPALMSGDVIRAVDGEPVKNLAALIEHYERIMNAQELPEYVLIEFDRRGGNQLTLLKPKPDEDVDPPREVAKAWLGVAVQPVLKELAKQLGQSDSVGFRITRVYPRTLAAGSELKVGDIIVALNGERLKPRGMQDAGLLHRRLRGLEIGDPATLTVLRDGQPTDVTVTLERTRMTSEEARRDHNRDFEIVVREVTFFDRDENRWDDNIRGVLVDRVEPAGWAQLGGVRPGDLIQRVDDRQIGDLEDYRSALKEVTSRRPERVVFVVLRGARTHFQYVEPDWSPGSGGGNEADTIEE